MHSAHDLLHFWFEEAGPRTWFKQSDSFDALCRERFQSTLDTARRGELWRWRETPAGRCAEIIVLDQLSRNLYRDDGRAYAQDSMALVLAQEAVGSGDHLAMTPQQRYFCYMPFMHSESLPVHDWALPLFEALGDPEALRYEKAHRAVIERFGRYPSRNSALGRSSTAEELDYLQGRKGW